MKVGLSILFVVSCVFIGQVIAQDGQATPARKPGHVMVQFLTVPSFARATVFHGRKKLGETPLYIQFPADSGPVDVVLKRAGYLWVNTRANTFKDDKVVVKMTKNDEASTLFGYREPPAPDGGLDGGLDGGPDGGAISDGGVAAPDAGVKPAPTMTP